jgi:hypothetical protein
LVYLLNYLYSFPRVAGEGGLGESPQRGTARKLPASGSPRAFLAIPSSLYLPTAVTITKMPLGNTPTATTKGVRLSELPLYSIVIKL